MTGQASQRMASSGMAASGFPGSERLKHAVGGGRESSNAYPGGVVNGIQDRGSSRDNGVLAQAFRSAGSNRSRLLDKNRFHGRQVSNGRYQIVVKVFTPAGNKFLHQGEAQALGNASLNLAFGKPRIDGTTRVMRGSHFEYAHAS